ncbi:MAG: Maf-like protein [Robiginitomaculum sp.]|nr:Maf-like protein [Robiginitomaculum sp.]
METHNTIILASASSIRFDIMTNAGIKFTCKPTNINEAIVKDRFLNEGCPASQLVERLALDKALAVKTSDDTVVIGADQVLEFDGKVFDKPKTRQETIERLLMLRGQEHRLVGAVCVVQKNTANWHYTSVAKLTMRKFSDAFLDDYMKKEGRSVLACVGGYKFETYGAQLFEKVEGDYFSILGLSLLPLLAELRRRGAILS